MGAARGRAAVAAPALAIAAAIAAPTARANGAFPEAGLVIVDPGDPAHLVVRATYGVVVTRDAGHAWEFVCEGAIGYANYDPMVGLTADGSLLAGLYQGLSASRDGGCSFGLVAGPWGDASVVDLAVRRGETHEVVMVTTATKADAGADARGRVWRSTDDGRTFAETAAPLPENFRALTIDVAPSDPARLYASGLVNEPGVAMKGAVARSSDGGATWAIGLVPGLGASTAPYVAAVDPADAGVVYVRSAGVPGRLFVSRDGGATFAEAWQAAGFLKAFALSPDGATIVAGGLAGLYRADTATMTFAKVSSLGASCLAWSAAGLHACATEKYAGFEIGLSQDAGETFAPVKHLPCVLGPLACAEGTSVATTCGAAWPAVAEQIGQPTCGRDAGAGGAGGAGSGGRGGATPTRDDGPAQAPAPGCGCAVAHEEGTGALAALVFAGLFAARRARPPAGPCDRRGGRRSSTACDASARSAPPPP